MGSKYSDALMADADDVGEPEPLGSINPFVSRIKYLPREMVFEFLSHLSAKVLHDVMRHVSEEWNLIIHSRDFIHHHLRKSTGGILIQGWLPPHDNIYVEMRRGCLEISKLDCRLKSVVQTSCNGLVLATDSIDGHILYVMNPLTKQRTALPPYFHEVRDYYLFGIAFVEASMEYKVVRVYGEGSFIGVLTVGVDKVWRCLDIKHFLLPSGRSAIGRPLVAGGYAHWVGETFVLTMNVETETVCRFPTPRFPTLYPRKWGNFLPMGSIISFINRRSKLLCDVWEMNPNTGKWIMTLRFDLKPVRARFRDVFDDMKPMVPLVPLGWLIVREALLFSTWFGSRHCIVYSFKTSEVRLIELSTGSKFYHFQGHTNSLVSLKGGS